MENGLRVRRLMDRMHERLGRLYGSNADTCLRRLKLMLRRYEEQLPPSRGPASRWSQADNVLVTYGDMVRAPEERPLRTLHRFLEKRLKSVIDTVHLLPFFPYSSDDGFSVIDYRQVDPELGTWEDVQRLGADFRLMFDLVLNHCSKRSDWFRDYITGIAPARSYFIEVEPFTDLSRVVRPRPSPLLTEVETRLGTRLVWTTFSEDQIDLDFRNCDVLMEFLDILLLYAAKGAHVIRLDAIAYLWKRIGTPCIHLPETHEVVKLIRDLLELAAPDALLVTETNVPQAENVSYFGDGDEAHLVYNFSLPPLLLHALQTGSGRFLTEWAASRDAPPPGCTYLNFTASHDGIGVRPLEGLVPQDEIDELIWRVEVVGGHVSVRSNRDGSTSPYELNITYFDAMTRPGEKEDADRKVERFLTSQAIALGLRGIPAVYFHSLVATANDHDAVEALGHARAINRHKWNEAALESRLDDRTSTSARVLEVLTRMLGIRSAQPAFHPDAPEQALAMSDDVFAFVRTAVDGCQTILHLSNLTDRTVEVGGTPSPFNRTACRDLLASDRTPLPAGRVTLEPYQTRWLTIGEE